MVTKTNKEKIDLIFILQTETEKKRKKIISQLTGDFCFNWKSKKFK